MYVQVLNPVDNKTHISPKEAERLVYYGHAAFVGPHRRQLRYLADVETVRLRRELTASYEDLEMDRQVDVQRGGATQGEWYPQAATTKWMMAGAPTDRNQQFDMTLRAIANGRRHRGHP
jgi:hypothetical protein